MEIIRIKGIIMLENKNSNIQQDFAKEEKI